MCCGVVDLVRLVGIELDGWVEIEMWYRWWWFCRRDLLDILQVLSEAWSAIIDVW